MTLHKRFTRAGLRLAAAAGLLALAACGGGNGDHITVAPEPGLPGCADDGSCASNPPLEIDSERPAAVMIPSDYDVTRRYPLMIVLHGYRATGALETIYLGLDTRVDTGQYVLVTPDGTENLNGDRFWNATPACCAAVAAEEDNSGEDYTQIDDVGYIRRLIEEAAATYSIDTSRITLFGHSNGAFLALRLACEASDFVTAVVSLAGSTFEDASSCAPATNPVSIRFLHGDADETIFYQGGDILGAVYPAAPETAKRFANLAGCAGDDPVPLPNVDAVASLEGAETTVVTYPDCDPGAEVELWTIVGGPHIPFPWVPAAIDSQVDWLLDHPRE